MFILLFKSFKLSAHDWDFLKHKIYFFLSEISTNLFLDANTSEQFLFEIKKM